MPETVRNCGVCGSLLFEVIDASGELCRCSCGYLFHSPRPSSAEISTFYDRDDQYEEWLDHEAERRQLWLRRWHKMSRFIGSHVELLDIGTGIGQFLSVIRTQVSKATGTELSDQARAIAKARYELDILKSDVMNADGWGQFSTITMFHVLEHVPDPGDLIDRCSELLTPNGVIIIAVPNDSGCLLAKIRCLLDRLRPVSQRRFCSSGYEKIILDDFQREVHLSHFTMEVLRKLLTSRGFTILEESLDPYFVASGFPLLCHRMFYTVSLMLWRALSINIYPTIWIVAKRD